MIEILSDPSIWLALFTLTALEIVLGIDNIIFISIFSVAKNQTKVCTPNWIDVSDVYANPFVIFSFLDYETHSPGLYCPKPFHQWS
jgi:hypothetical protein